MFEKEAEEWANKMYPSDGQAQRYLLMGAKFGYNKVKEWHYLKDDYPPLGTDVLICIKLLNSNKAVKIGSFQQDGGVLIEGFICSADAVIAWQPLPNLPTEG